MDRSAKSRLKLRKTTVKNLTADRLEAAAGASIFCTGTSQFFCTVPTLQANCLLPTRVTICVC